MSSEKEGSWWLSPFSLSRLAGALCLSYALFFTFQNSAYPRSTSVSRLL